MRKAASRLIPFGIVLAAAGLLAACATGGDGADPGSDSDVPDVGAPSVDSSGADMMRSDATSGAESGADRVNPGADAPAVDVTGGTDAGDNDANDEAPEPMDSAVPETALPDTSVPDTSSGEEGGDAGVDVAEASTPDASDGGMNPADAGPCNTMWPAGGTNSVTNPDFESATAPGAGWATRFGGGTFAVSSTTAHCGMNSGEISGRTQPYQAIATPIPTAAGAYTVALWVRQDGTGNLQLTIQGTGACGADAGTQYINLSPTTGGFPTIAPNTWTFATGTLTVPANCTSMFLAVSQNGAQSLTAPFPDVFVDDVFVGQ
jgi:hypothetical protein